MSVWTHDLLRLTEKQVAALEAAAVRIEKMHGSPLGFWSIAYAEEIRPGRGHDITAWAADGEAMATQYLDPYGYGPLVLSRTELVHNDADEEHHDEEGNCECEAGQ